MRRSSARIPHPPLKFVWRHTPKGDDALFSTIREHAERGAEVRVQRIGRAPFSIVRNGSMWLVRPADGSPVGSFENIAAAVMAGDRHLDARDEDDFGDDEPQGVA